jgi:hypothetical protein
MRLLLALCALLGFAAAAAAQPPPAADSCHVGAYRLADGRIVDMALGQQAGRLRWRTMDGNTGSLGPQPDGGWKTNWGLTGRPDTLEIAFGTCEAGEVRFGGVVGHKVALDVRDTTFDGAGGVKLAGRLVLPAGRRKGPGLSERARLGEHLGAPHLVGTAGLAGAGRGLVRL